MSPAAKMIYAAAFAFEYRNATRNPPAKVTMDGARWNEWELEQATHAAEVASTIADRFDELEARVMEGFGDCKVTKNYLEMRHGA